MDLINVILQIACENISAPHKNAVSVFEIKCKIMTFYLGRFLKELAGGRLSSTTKDGVYHNQHNGHFRRDVEIFLRFSTVFRRRNFDFPAQKHYTYTIFYDGSGLICNWMF